MYYIFLNEAVNISGQMIQCLMNNELEKLWKWPWTNLRHHPDTFLEKMKKTVKF
jgi:hypothetical protein